MGRGETGVREGGGAGVTGRAPSGAFTLVEVLVVVAIIAVLAAVAVPNFLLAQSRAKTARAVSDMRTLATALETYAADNARYPSHAEALADGTVNYPAVRAGLTTVEFTPDGPLTTPVAYLTAVPVDPTLASGGANPAWPPGLPGSRYGYVETRGMAAIMTGRGLGASAARLEPRYGAWRLMAAGPDGDRGDAKSGRLYDPTNGTVSDGDLMRSQRNPVEFLSADE